MMTQNSIIHRSFAQKADDKSKAQDQIWMIPATTCTTSSRSSRSESTKHKSITQSGVCKEQARWFLPQNTNNRRYWSGSMDAWATCVNLRLHRDTQYETRIRELLISTRHLMIVAC